MDKIQVLFLVQQIFLSITVQMGVQVEPYGLQTQQYS